MKLVVGLGNPGAKYQLTRHNVGFMVVDELVEQWQLGPFRNEHKALTVRSHDLQSEIVILAKPQTYMNLSGESVQALMKYYRVDLKDLLVIHDDLDLEFGTLRYQSNRGHGGHNGIKSIHQVLLSPNYQRLKMGIGRPSQSRMDIADFVLQNFNQTELEILPEFLGLASESIKYWLTHGLEKTATTYNRDSQRK